MREIVILGGGISGLSLAYYLKSFVRSPSHFRNRLRNLHPSSSAGALTSQNPRKIRIRIVEASPRLGGWIHTETTPSGYLFEFGPRGFRPSRSGSEVLNLIEQLGLQDEMLTVTPAAATSRYILHNQRMEKVPTNLWEFIRWPLARQVVAALFNEAFAKPIQLTDDDDESIHDFITRRFNASVADWLIDPMASGIFGGDIRKLSIRCCFPILIQMEQQYGSIIRGMLLSKLSQSPKKTLLDGSEMSEFVRRYERAVSISFRSGMYTLVDALRKDLEESQECEIHFDSKATKLEVVHQDNLAQFQLELETEEKARQIIRATDVYSTIPAKHIAPIVQNSYPEMAKALQRVQYASIGMIHLGYEASVLHSDGFGYLVPSLEDEKVLGVVYDSCAFPDQNASRTKQTRLTVMCGGARHPEIQSLLRPELENIAISAVARHLGISAQPNHVNAVLLEDCIPQYHVGMWQTRKSIEAHAAAISSRFRLGGNNFCGVGLADCVHRSKQLALEFFQDNFGSSA
uniref:Protoporphyrinogen oxidase n=1 Tax=Albugo laibachii Nc14 TaxID=890382 RepID=F0WRR8_9STRA|nr:protoporphyrinogen oxidase putative [Albugo laibachii Nc14]|eukprot:CCA24033.1 protoporphyrinogen oxidase putative [Albugo laibachii Nc14]